MTSECHLAQELFVSGDTQVVAQPIGLTSPSVMRPKSHIFPPLFAVAIVSQAQQKACDDEHNIHDIIYKAADNKRYRHRYRDRIYVADDEKIQLFEHTHTSVFLGHSNPKSLRFILH